MCLRKILMNFAFKMVAVVLALGVMILGNVNITKADINLYNKALDYASKLNFIEAEKSFKSFITNYPRHKKHKDAQYWLGKVYFAQKKYEEAAITLAEFNSLYPNNSRYQETTLLIAEASVNFAPQIPLCNILNNSLHLILNPTEKFVKRIKYLQLEKNCDDIKNSLWIKDYNSKNRIHKKYNEPKPLKDEYVTNEMLDNYINKTKPKVPEITNMTNYELCKETTYNYRGEIRWKMNKTFLEERKEAKNRGLDCGVKNDNKTVVVSSPNKKVSTTNAEYEEEKRQKLLRKFGLKEKIRRLNNSELSDCHSAKYKDSCFGYSIKENGVEYIGEWKNNKRHGLGTTILLDGREYTGYWEDGIFKGKSYKVDNIIKNYANIKKPSISNSELEKERAKRLEEERKRKELERRLAALEKQQKEQQQSKPKTIVAKKPQSEFPLKPIPINFPSVSVKRDDIAVIIGNANYKKQGKDIPNVNPAYADAEGIKQYFMKAKGVREGNIIYLKDATNAQLLGVFGNDKSHKGKLFNYIKPNKSNVYIYYAGHGAPGEEGDAYLVPTDTDSQTIEFTGYPLSTLYSNLGKLPAKSMTVILEACFSGGSQSGSLISRASPIVIQPKKTFIPNNIKVIAAGSERQMASWEEDSSHSLFTKYFLKAMSGEGDSNKDGKVSDNELKDYLSDTMTYFARRYYGRDQKVQIHNGG